jgi:hypothetical protein
VTRTVAALEADLKRVRKDAEAFGRDLKLLRIEKERLEAKQKEELANVERARSQSQAQIRLLNEQLEGEREKTSQAIADLRNHVCVMYVPAPTHDHGLTSCFSLATSNDYRRSSSNTTKNAKA